MDNFFENLIFGSNFIKNYFNALTIWKFYWQDNITIIRGFIAMN